MLGSGRSVFLVTAFEANWAEVAQGGAHPVSFMPMPSAGYARLLRDGDPWDAPVAVVLDDVSV